MDDATRRLLHRTIKKVSTDIDVMAFNTAAGRIGLIGWSHGGITTLHAVDDVYLSRLGTDRFRAAIAFYPGCLIRLLRLNAPLLILIGEEDDWTPAARCRRMEVEPETSHQFTLKIYPGAYHEFDRPDRNADVYLGHRLERHHEAAHDAEQPVQRFLIHHLGPRGLGACWRGPGPGRGRPVNRPSPPPPRSRSSVPAWPAPQRRERSRPACARP